MEPMSLTMGILFLLGYVGISLEHTLKVSKSAIALVLGGMLWIIASWTLGERVSGLIAQASVDIFGVVVFLLAAMSLVEILVHYKLFDVIRAKLVALKLSVTQLFFVITGMTFILSSVIDNLTSTIIAIQIARQFFRGDNLLKVAVGIVIAANAGGAFSPIGDVTTLMLWIAGKYTAVEILRGAILPSIVLCGVSIWLLSRTLDPEHYVRHDELIEHLEGSERFVVAIAIGSFTLPLVMNMFHLPPYLGLLIGLGVVWLTIDAFKHWRPRPSHLSATIEQLIQKIDLAAVKFFIGILLAVAALNASGILSALSQSLYGDAPNLLRFVGGNIGLGFVSAVLDNVPLTAIAITILKTTDPSLWVLLALTVGTGGSLLVVGSAAGVMAMGMVKELSFMKYLRVGTGPALVGYMAGVSTWALQRWIVG